MIVKKLPDEIRDKSASIDERIKFGKSLRQKYPREKAGEYKVPAKRTDPVAVLETQAKQRLKELVPIRHDRMLASPFAFLRGAAAIMAADLAGSGNTNGIQVQCSGDLHVANFGVFASAERRLIFGINDFDETLPGPWEWDLKRLVASIVVSGKHLGADKTNCEEAVRTCVSTYRKRMREYAQMGGLELWYTSILEEDIKKTLSRTAVQGLKKITDKARERTNLQVLDKLGDLVDEKFRLKENAPFIVREKRTSAGTPIEKAIQNFLGAYLPSLADDRKFILQQYKIVDVARKVVGVGSVGTRCWVIYLRGNHENDPLFLQLKEAQPSVLEKFVGKTEYKNNGQRVVAGQRLIQGAPDIFLGWGRLEGFDFYVRQLRDMKGGVEFDREKIEIRNFPQYTALCGWVTALAHAKSGDAAMLSGYIGKSETLDDAMVKFAFAYSDQTQKDFDSMKKAAKSGRLKTIKTEI